MALRTTLETVARMTGREPPELTNPHAVEPQVEHLWAWFLTLRAGQPLNLDAPAAITEAEIGWFFRNRSIVPDGWEPDAIRWIDRSAIDGLCAKDE